MRKAEIMLLGSVTFLGTWAFVQSGSAPPSPDRVRVTPARESMSTLPSVFELPPVEVFDDIVARPLFEPSRRPVVVDGAESAALKDTVAPPPRLGANIDISLTGVVIDGDRGIALVVHNGKTDRVRTGEPVAGWRVETIETERVVLGQGTARVELALRPFDTDPGLDASSGVSSNAVQSQTREDDLLELLTDDEKPELLKLLAEEDDNTTEIRSLRPSISGAVY
jgi:general secretion pathway protein N